MGSGRLRPAALDPGYAGIGVERANVPLGLEGLAKFGGLARRV
jgi:hypothetical protein